MKKEERILNATLAVVRKQTISGTRMHLIADEAKMLQSNLHYYYKTKEDLLMALQEKVLEKCLEIRTELRKGCRESFKEEFEVFIKQKREFIMTYRDYDYAEMDFWVQGRINETIRNNFAKSFEVWRRELKDLLMKYYDGLDKDKQEYLPSLIVSYLEGATIQYLIDVENFDLDGYLAFGEKMFLELL